MGDYLIFGDASELSLLEGHSSPNIILITAFSTPRDKYTALISEVRQIKKTELGDEDAPIKWNLKDGSLKKAYEDPKLKTIYPELIEKSDEIRLAILDALMRHGAVFFLSVIQAYSTNKQVLGKTKSDIISFCFGNLLMRLGLFIKDQEGGSTVQAVFDWPEGQNREPFMGEYVAGWKTGKSMPPNAALVKYECGSLKELGFEAAPFFAVTLNHPALQLADFICGACREFVNYACGKARRDSFGVKTFFKLLPFFDKNKQGRNMGRGITVAPPRKDLANAIVLAL